jgi:hypothetical protein
MGKGASITVVPLRASVYGGVILAVGLAMGRKGRAGGNVE